MSKSLLRIVAVLIVPCLIGDPVLAGGITAESRNLGPSPSADEWNVRFVQEALDLPAEETHEPIMSGAIGAIEAWKDAHARHKSIIGPDVRERAREYWKDYFASIIAKFPGARILDIATGRFAVLKYAQKTAKSLSGGLELHGQDAAPVPIEQVPAGMHFHESSLETLDLTLSAGDPVPSGYFDVITSLFGFEYSNDLWRTLVRVNQLLRMGGSFVLITHRPDSNIVLNASDDLKMISYIQGEEIIEWARLFAASPEEKFEDILGKPLGQLSSLYRLTGAGRNSVSLRQVATLLQEFRTITDYEKARRDVDELEHDINTRKGISEDVVAKSKPFAPERILSTLKLFEKAGFRVTKHPEPFNSQGDLIGWSMHFEKVSEPAGPTAAEFLFGKPGIGSQQPEAPDSSLARDWWHRWHTQFPSRQQELGTWLQDAFEPWLLAVERGDSIPADEKGRRTHKMIEDARRLDPELLRLTYEIDAYESDGHSFMNVAMQEFLAWFRQQGFIIYVDAGRGYPLEFHAGIPVDQRRVDSTLRESPLIFARSLMNIGPPVTGYAGSDITVVWLDIVESKAADCLRLMLNQSAIPEESLRKRDWLLEQYGEDLKAPDGLAQVWRKLVEASLSTVEFEEALHTYEFNRHKGTDIEQRRWNSTAETDPMEIQVGLAKLAWHPDMAVELAHMGLADPNDAWLFKNVTADENNLAHIRQLAEQAYIGTQGDWVIEAQELLEWARRNHLLEHYQPSVDIYAQWMGMNLPSEFMIAGPVDEKWTRIWFGSPAFHGRIQLRNVFEDAHFVAANILIDGTLGTFVVHWFGQTITGPDMKLAEKEIREHFGYAILDSIYLWAKQHGHTQVQVPILHDGGPAFLTDYFRSRGVTARVMKTDQQHMVMADLKDFTAPVAAPAHPIDVLLNKNARIVETLRSRLSGWEWYWQEWHDAGNPPPLTEHSQEIFQNEIAFLKTILAAIDARTSDGSRMADFLNTAAESRRAVLLDWQTFNPIWARLKTRHDMMTHITDPLHQVMAVLDDPQALQELRAEVARPAATTEPGRYLLEDRLLEEMLSQRGVEKPRVLDRGVSTGVTTQELQQRLSASVIAVDQQVPENIVLPLTPYMLLRGWEHSKNPLTASPGIEFRQADITQALEGLGHLDLVRDANVLQHLSVQVCRAAVEMVFQYAGSGDDGGLLYHATHGSVARLTLLSQHIFHIRSSDPSDWELMHAGYLLHLGGKDRSLRFSDEELLAYEKKLSETVIAVRLRLMDWAVALSSESVRDEFGRIRNDVQVAVLNCISVNPAAGIIDEVMIGLAQDIMRISPWTPIDEYHPGRFYRDHGVYARHELAWNFTDTKPKYDLQDLLTALLTRIHELRIAPSDPPPPAAPAVKAGPLQVGRVLVEEEVKLLQLDLLPFHGDRYEVEDNLHNSEIDVGTQQLVRTPRKSPVIPVQEIRVLILKESPSHPFQIYRMIVLDEHTQKTVARADLRLVPGEGGDYYKVLDLSESKVDHDYRNQALLQRAMTLVVLTSRRQGWISSQQHSMADPTYKRMRDDSRLDVDSSDNLWIVKPVGPVEKPKIGGSPTSLGPEIRWGGEASERAIRRWDRFRREPNAHVGLLFADSGTPPRRGSEDNSIATAVRELERIKTGLPAAVVQGYERIAHVLSALVDIRLPQGGAVIIDGTAGSA